MDDLPEEDSPLPSKDVSIDLTGTAESVYGEYEKRPYPAEDERVLSDRRWKLAPIRWWLTTGLEREDLPPSPRILVAGCGTGNEAFNCARYFKDAEVVGVDFSPRSIEIAEKWKQPSGLTNVTFYQADLTDKDFASRVGGQFDLISCHGVASYIPQVERALANFGKCLKDDGSIYLGVNGQAHISTRYRHLITAFELDPLHMEEPARARRVLSLGDALLGLKKERCMARQSDSYIASDVFGSEINNRSLREWLELGEQSGLCFLGSYNAMRQFSNLSSKAQLELAMEKDPAEMHALADTFRPVTFHRILFGKESRRRPSFRLKDREDLLTWRPLAGLFDRKKLPPLQKPYNRSGQITVDIPGLYKSLKMNVSVYILEFLRLSDGSLTVQEIMNQIDYEMNVDEIAMLMCRLYLMGLLHLCQPES